MKKTWPPEAYQSQFALPLPEPPGVRHPLKRDVCPRCHSVHLNCEDDQRCRTANAQREQY